MIRLLRTEKLGLFLLTCLFLSDVQAALQKPIVIGHRGASGHRPEHTLASYQLAIEMGADFIEPDLVMSKDKVLIVRHENEISGTTDVATKFPDRKTTKTIDGEKITGWFSEDFTLQEIKTLRAKERLEFRNHAFDGKFAVVTFAEVLELLQKKSKKQKRRIGVYPETKHPTYFASIGLPLEEALVSELKKFGYNKKDSPVYIQSFELSNLQKLKKITPVPLVFLLGEPQQIPFDFVAEGRKTTYLELFKPEGLQEIAKVASGIGPYKRYLIPETTQGESAPNTNLVEAAHAAGLVVHPYTFRDEEKYLLPSYAKDPQKEYLQFFALGVDGVFSDFPDSAVKARSEFLQTQKPREIKNKKE